MAAVPFLPPVAPMDPMEDAHQPVVNRVAFGNGYTQRSRPGINNDPERPSVKWENLTKTEYDYIWGFFRARAGTESFTYKLPWEDGEGDKKYLCVSYTRQKQASNVYHIQAVWEEVFEA